MAKEELIHWTKHIDNGVGFLQFISHAVQDYPGIDCIPSIIFEKWAAQNRSSLPFQSNDWRKAYKYMMQHVDEYPIRTQSRITFMKTAFPVMPKSISTSTPSSSTKRPSTAETTNHVPTKVPRSSAPSTAPPSTVPPSTAPTPSTTAPPSTAHSKVRPLRAQPCLPKELR